MTSRVIFKINRMPHPQKEHLVSRIRNLGTIVYYGDDVIAIDTSSPKSVVLNVKPYLKDHHVTFTYRTTKVSKPHVYRCPKCKSRFTEYSPSYEKYLCRNCGETFYPYRR
jgi:predicted Zn-ribbon and HTH transcriptional regulator